MHALVVAVKLGGALSFGQFVAEKIPEKKNTSKWAKSTKTYLSWLVWIL